MRAFFDAIDQMPADSTFVIVGVLAVTFVIERLLRERTFTYRAACERIEGFIHGYREGRAGKMPAVNVEIEAKVPAAFERGMGR